MSDQAWLPRYLDVGYAVVPAVLDGDAVEALRAECDRMASLPGILDPDNLRTQVAASGPRTADRIDPVMDLSEPMAAIMTDQRIVAIATACVGGPAALLKDKLILKPPGATGYVMHQDAAYFPVDDPPPNAVALVLALDDSGPDNGGLLIVPRTHQTLLSTPNVPTDLDPDDLAPPDAVELAAGDVLAMSVLAPHRSDLNTSGRPRRHLYLTFAPDDGTDQRSAYYEAQHRRLREQLPPERRALAHFR